jgi:hypothetical protein
MFWRILIGSYNCVFDLGRFLADFPLAGLPLLASKRPPPLPLSDCNSPTVNRTQRVPACLVWSRAVSGAVAPDVSYLLLNIPLHLLESNQCGFEQ